MTIVQPGGGELVELHEVILLSLRIVWGAVASPTLVDTLSVSFSPSLLSLRSMLVSELEEEMVTVGRVRGLRRFGSDSELGALMDATAATCMSFQCTTFPGFRGVPELTLRIGLSCVGRYFLQ